MRKSQNHLALKLDNNRVVYISCTDESESDSALCNKGGYLMAKLWDSESRVIQASTWITKRRI